MLRIIKNLTTTVLVLCSLLAINFESSAQQKYYHLLEKQKYSKIEKKGGKDLAKAPEDIILNHVHALLYSARNYKKYNTDKSYDFLLNTQKLYANVFDQKQIGKLQKIPINSSSLSDDLYNICQKALDDVIEKNTIENYQYYLDYYSRASGKLRQKAMGNRNSLAYADASTINTVASYQEFIDTYPYAREIPKAIEYRDHLAFEKVKQENTAAAYQKFTLEYPRSKEYKEAYELFETRLFEEQTISGDHRSYQDFILAYPGNRMVSFAIDSLIQIGTLAPIRFAAQNSSGADYSKAVLAYYQLYTSDGELQTLYQFKNDFPEFEFRSVYARDIEVAEQGDQLKLELSYNTSSKADYLNYIKIAAPKERAFVALQRIISIDIKNKKWSNAIKSIHEVQQYFGVDDARINTLIELLQAKWDKSIVVHSVGSGVNTKEGGEYIPVISADNKYLYFCGKGRKDNLGGEDIYVSKRKGSSWSKALLVAEISDQYYNDAPLSISTDGTTMIFFRNGAIYTANKLASGWGDINEIEGPINSGLWSADAMFSSDGNAMIFSSIRKENYNYNVEENYSNREPYHGSRNHQADIYVCIKNEDDQWGEAINLGPAINTIYCDRSPFLHPDMKTLYFSSDGHGGIGKLDVYKSTRLADTCWDCWSEPVNMGKEINTVEMDWGYRITTNGKTAYFAVRRSNEKNDIFRVNLPPHLRPDFVATISGKLLNIDGTPVAANIKWEDLSTGKDVGISKSDPSDGSFFVVLPLGKIYGYYVEKNSYFPLSNNIDLRHSKESSSIEENIQMVTFEQMIDEGIAVPINNLFFDYNKYELLDYSIPELKRVAKIIIENNLNTEINGHTDNIGDDKFNLELSINRASAVQEFLIKEGVVSDMLEVVGHGESNPVASNETDKGRAKNRRVEINFVKN